VLTVAAATPPDCDTLAILMFAMRPVPCRVTTSNKLTITMLVPHPANAPLLVLPLLLSLTLLQLCLQNPITQRGMPIYALIHERYRWAGQA
jgi:hypothetical protein